MVSLAVAAPVVKSVELAEAVQMPARAPRASVTVTVPRAAEIVAEPAATDDSELLAGDVTLRAPDVSENVVDVSAACAGAAKKPATAVAVMMSATSFFMMDPCSSQSPREGRTSYGHHPPYGPLL